MLYEKYPEELFHTGRLGMKWGKHIYGQKSLPSPRRRRSKVKEKAKTAYRKGRSTVDKIGKNITDKDVKSIVSSTNMMSGGTRGLSSYAQNKKMDKQMRNVKIAGMSDEDLRRKVNRMQLEQNYARLKANEVYTGMDHVNNVLSVASDVVAVVGGAAMIGLTIKNLMTREK